MGNETKIMLNTAFMACITILETYVHTMVLSSDGSDTSPSNQTCYINKMYEHNSHTTGLEKHPSDYICHRNSHLKKQTCPYLNIF